MPRLARLAHGAAACLLALGASLAPAEPDFFTDKPYAEARLQAEKDGKLLFVKATAVWCGPCKRMDRTTFTDQRVIDWLTERAVSVSVDVDDQPGIARDLSVRAMPTTILFREGEELARVVGYRDADGLLEWLAGATDPDADRAEAGNVPSGNMQTRLQHARELFFRGDLEKATSEYVWLWENMTDVEPAMTGVRVSFMASEMHELAGFSPAARKAFERFRDEAGDRLRKGPRTWEDLDDWLVLNERVLNDREKILAWIDRIKDRPTAGTTFSRVSHVVMPILIDEGRWRLFGSLVENPDSEMRSHSMMLEINSDRRAYSGFSDVQIAEFQRMNEEMFREDTAQLHAGLLAADRTDDAWRVAALALETLDDTKTRSALIRTADEAGTLSERHLDLLDKNNPDHAPLIKLVRESLDD